MPRAGSRCNANHRSGFLAGLVWVALFAGACTTGGHDAATPPPPASAAAADVIVIAACHFTSGPLAGGYEELNAENQVSGSPCDNGKLSSGEVVLFDSGPAGSSMSDSGRRTYKVGTQYCIFERGPRAGDQVDWKGGRVGQSCTVGQNSGAVH